MPRGGARPNTGGARPGAGRPSAVDEALRARVIEKSWSIVEEFYNDANESKSDKRKVAVYLAGKSVPQNLNVTGELSHNIFMQNLIAKSRDNV